MATVSVSFRVPEETKRNAELVCKELGISMSTVLTMCLNSVVRKRGLPSDITTLGEDDPLQKYRNETQEETNARILSSAKDIADGNYTVFSLEEVRDILYGNQV